MDKKNIAGVILSAGDSKRMGQPKALLNLNGETFLNTIIKNLVAAYFDPLILVLGTNYELVKESLPDDNKINLLRNPNPEQGQLSSLQIAINELPPDCNGLLQTLVDHPLVKLSTYKFLYNEAQKKNDEIIIPVFRGRRGHPVYFGKKYFSDLLNAPLNRGARYVVDKYSKQVQHLEIMDKGVILDIDTPIDYQTYI